MLAIRRTVVIVSLAVLLLVLAGCGENGAGCSASRTAELSPRKAAAQPGEKVRFKVPAEADGLTVAWQTNAYPDGGSISDDGVFSAPSKPGLYLVTATYTLKDGTDVQAEGWVGVMEPDEPASGSETAGDGVAFSVDESAGVESELYYNGNDLAVFNGGKSPSFTLAKPAKITSVMTYHWNDGMGVAGGTIAFKGSDGKTYGPWPTRTEPTSGPNVSVYWYAEPGVVIPAGTYTVVDSNPETWAKNDESAGLGMTAVKGVSQ